MPLEEDTSFARRDKSHPLYVSIQAQFGDYPGLGLRKGLDENYSHVREDLRRICLMGDGEFAMWYLSRRLPLGGLARALLFLGDVPDLLSTVDKPTSRLEGS